MPLTRYGHRHSLGITRREFLQVGYSGLLGIGLAGLLADRSRGASSAPAARGVERPRPKSVILVFLTGGASQLDLFDLKPDAPAEIRGDFRPIATTVPGVSICEHLPRLAAAKFDQWALIRSLSHRDGSHLPATHHTLTGRPMPLRRGSDQDNVLSRRDAPCYAAALEYLQPRGDGIPSGVMLPNHLIEGPLTWPGQHAGFLGPRFDPWHIAQDPNSPTFRVDNLRLPAGVGVRRLSDRHALLGELDGQGLASSWRGQCPPVRRSARASLFDPDRQPRGAGLRARSRAPRRPRPLRPASLRPVVAAGPALVEAGVPIVQANMGIVQTWDTHSNNFSRLKNQLLPPLDIAVSALFDDLAARGLFDDTLVIMLGEFGRAPKISTLPTETSPGRDHWASLYSGVFAGGGVRGGQVIGKSDRFAAQPVTTSFSPDDIGATVYHALGVDLGSEVRDRQDRPVRLSTGQVIQALYTGKEA